MLLVQDQYVQNSRKNFDSELQLKQNTSKQFSDPKDIWHTESGCEEVNSSGNNSEEEDNFLYADHSDLPEEVFQSRKPGSLRKKNVRFGAPDFNYVLDTTETSSLDNEYFGIDCGYFEPSHRRPAQDPDITHKIKDAYRIAHKPRWRPKSSPDNSPNCLPAALGDYDPQSLRRKDHCCGRHHGDFHFDDIAYKNPTHKSHKYACGDDVTTRCCDHCLAEPRPKTTFLKMKPMPAPGHKHVCLGMKEPESEAKGHRSGGGQGLTYHSGLDRYCADEYCEHGYASKSKKKILEAVQEQQEQLSDSTYKVACSKFSSQSIHGEVGGHLRKRSSEKVGNLGQSDWVWCGGRGSGGSLGERMGPPRIHKMRSRRTRMNKLKIGWKKALVQTVRDGSRNERVGVIVMGSKGPEFYSKNSEKPAGFVPFRRSKSFLDGAAKSFEVMTVDCKNVFLSSSEPGPRTNYAINDLVCPEDDDKVEEKIAKFSKNVNDIVKTSEEKFYKALSSSEFPEKKKPTGEALKGTVEGAQEANKDENKEDVPRTKCPPFRLLSPRLPKHLKSPDKPVSEESKAMADALNAQAKQYLEKQSRLQDEGACFLEGFPELKETSQEKVDRNLSLWGMKLGHLPERFDAREQTGGEEACKKTLEEPDKNKPGKDEISHTGSIKSTEQISLNKQRRKKYYETTTSGLKEAEAAADADDSKSRSGTATPNTPQRHPNTSKWPPSEPFHRQHLNHPDSSLISAVFRDLVENGCAISQEESENLQSIFHEVSLNADMCSNDAMSSCSSEGVDTGRGKSPSSGEGGQGREGRVEGGGEAKGGRLGKGEDSFEEVNSKKVLKMNLLEEKMCKKVQRKSKEGKKKKICLEDRMKLLREALPSIAAENEATHLKQLKKYIDRFIDRVEASTTTEFCSRRDNRAKSKETSSTDSNEIRVDARKILEFVSNPFRKISSDVTISIAKKLTDALVQDKSSRGLRAPPPPTKARKHSDNETDEDGFVACEPSSGSERCEEPEPTYLKQLKKMRKEHLNNIVLEVKRLSELLRFLDRCNRLHF